MSRYTADSRDRVLAAVDMLALVGARVELTRRGFDSYFGICPFHDERTPSFHVRPGERHYHCFGCGTSGDPFDFVKETEGLDFKGALESLADRFGIALETADEDPGAARRRERRARLHTLLDRTAAFYSRCLWESDEAERARAYLLERGLEAETLHAFRVGYAPNAFDRILDGSARAGYTTDELLAAGLIRRSERSRRGAYDFFREQIMFPALDARGRVRGFGARRMREDQNVAKYVNTPDGDLYHKREVLYGIDLARSPAARAGRMILVEGYTDVLALHGSGILNAVGIMGTSFTEEQLSELVRVVPVLELCLDADSAGQEAMLRAARLAAGRGVELRAVVLPEGQDPADLVLASGPEALRERITRSVPFVAFNVRRILRGADVTSAEGRDRALAELAPAFAGLPPSVLRDELTRTVAGELELTDARLQRLLEDPPGRRGGGGRGPAVGVGSPGEAHVSPRAPGEARAGPRAPGEARASSRVPGASEAAAAPLAPGSRAERLYLALCLAVPEAGEPALAAPEAELLLTDATLRRLARHLRGRTRAPLGELPDDDEPLARALPGLVELAGRVPDPSPDRLEHARLVLELERLERAIRRARAAGEGTSELAREREDVREAYRAAVARLEKPL